MSEGSGRLDLRVETLAAQALKIETYLFRACISASQEE